MPSNIRKMVESYIKNLFFSEKDAMDMARLTKGYSFAFQVLGCLIWEKTGDYKETLGDYRQQLVDLVCDKIWPELSEQDKRTAEAMSETEKGKSLKSRIYLGKLTISSIHIKRDSQEKVL